MEHLRVAMQDWFLYLVQALGKRAEFPPSCADRLTDPSGSREPSKATTKLAEDMSCNGEHNPRSANTRVPSIAIDFRERIDQATIYKNEHRMWKALFGNNEYEVPDVTMEISEIRDVAAEGGGFGRIGKAELRSEVVAIKQMRPSRDFVFSGIEKMAESKVIKLYRFTSGHSVEPDVIDFLAIQQRSDHCSSVCRNAS